MAVTFSVDKVVQLFNQLLSTNHDAMLDLVRKKAYVDTHGRNLLHLKGNHCTILGIINEIGRLHGAGDLVIGANCEFSDGEIVKINFFHKLDTSLKS